MSTIKANTLLHSDGTTTTQPSIPALDKRMAKAWINFDMTAASIRASYGISSITDSGVGDFFATFSTAMPNLNYAPVGNCVLIESTGGQIWIGVAYFVTDTTKFRILGREVDNNAPSFTAFDEDQCYAAVFSN
tara:strand:+ start:260 stop:658 length:399 start_codon:yes stop_codon:yes gene_type:complete